MVPLYSMIRGKKAPRSALKWTADTKKAFVDTKDCLANFTALASCAYAKISLVTDVSDDLAGAVLQQEVDGVV